MNSKLNNNTLAKWPQNASLGQKMKMQFISEYSGKAHCPTLQFQSNKYKHLYEGFSHENAFPQESSKTSVLLIG